MPGSPADALARNVAMRSSKEVRVACVGAAAQEPARRRKVRLRVDERLDPDRNRGR